jgi:opacity protein-like surface antigen
MIAPDWRLYARRGLEMARLMRWLICAVVLVAFAPGAYADDLDILRGPQSPGSPAFTRWSGFYFGGHAGYSGANANFQGTTQGPLAYALRDSVIESTFAPSQWPLLGDDGDTTTSYGGFVGINTQWQNLVLGGEIDYSRANMAFEAPSTPIARSLTTVDSNTQAETLYDLSASGSGTLRLIDYASLRARAGWIFGNNFLPYGFGGFVIGRGDFTETASIEGPTATTVPTLISTPSGGLTTFQPAPALPCTVLAFGITESCSIFGASTSNSATGTLMYGFSVGGGVDIALMSNIFLRGEFEYVHFLPYNGIVVDLATARIGAGFKF